MAYNYSFLFTKTVDKAVRKVSMLFDFAGFTANSPNCPFINHCVSKNYSYKIYGDGIPQGPLRMYNESVSIDLVYV